MRPDEVLARRLAGEVAAELDALAGLARELRDAPTDDDTFSLRARASILHDAYTAVERIFVRIAEELNGGVPRGDQWHRQLLKDMTLALPEVRPALITDDLAEELGELLRFRHVVRNVYGSVLEAERLRPLEDRLDGLVDRFTTQLRAFTAWMVGEDRPPPAERE